MVANAVKATTGIHRYTTQSGSEYEVDYDRKLARQTKNPKGRVSQHFKGEEWVPFRDAGVVGDGYYGNSLFFHWRDMKYTITSELENTMEMPLDEEGLASPDATGLKAAA